MSQRSENNNRTYPLDASGGEFDSVFTGLAEETGDFTAISVSVVVPTVCLLTIEQSFDKVNWYFSEQFTVEPNTHRTFQQCIVLEYFRVVLANQGILQTFCHMISSRSQNLTQNVNIRNLTTARDAVAFYGQDEAEVYHPIQATSTGDLIVNGSSSSATRPVYLMEVGTFYRVASVGNTAGHVWTSIGAIVGSETEPTIGRFFKCLSVPANIEGQGTVYDVEFTDQINVVSVGGVQAVSGTVSVDNFPAYQSSIEVSNFPATQPISGSVSLLASADPTIELGKVRITDSYGAGISATAGNVMVGINNIYTVNPLHTIVDSGSITTTESASLIASFTESSGKGNIKTSAGSLQSLSIVNDNTALAFVALYNATSGNVTAGTTAPLAVLVIQKNQAIQLAMNNLAFSTAICFFVATAYNGGTELGNVYLTASYN